MRMYSASKYEPKELFDIGAAIGTWLGQNNMIMTATDGRRISRLVRRALTVGLAYTGITVLDLRMVPDVVLRYEIWKQGMGAGLYVPFDGEKVHVFLYNEKGEPLEDDKVREINRICDEKKFNTASLFELGTVLYYPNGIEDYIKYCSEIIHFKNEIKLLADCQMKPIAMLIPGLFENYGMHVVLFNGLVSGYDPPRPKSEFLTHLLSEEYDIGLRFMDEIEIYDRKGEILKKEGSLKAVLEFLKDVEKGGKA